MKSTVTVIDRTNVMEGFEPIYLKGNKTGVLGLHGFTSAPYDLEKIGRYLNKESGYTVNIPLLPGHGTSIDDLKTLGWNDWTEFLEKEYQDMKQHCDEIFIIGYSLGGLFGRHSRG